MQYKSRIESSVYNLLSGFGGSILAIIMKFAVRTVFAYTLGKAYLGINGLFADVISMLSLAELGFDTAINYRLYKPLAENNDKRVRVLLKFYKHAYRGVGIAILILGGLLAPFLKFIINDYDSLEQMEINAIFIFVIYLLQSVSTYLFLAYRSIVIKATQHEYVINIAGGFITFVESIFEIFILIFWGDFIAYTISIVLFNVVRNIVNAIIAERMYPQYFLREKENLTKKEIVSLFKDCGAAFLHKTNSVVLKATDNILVSAFLGLTTVGLYSNYLLIFNAVMNILERFFAACRDSIGNIYATEDLSKNYFVFEIINFLAFILYGTACVGLSIVLNEFINIWLGSEYLLPYPLPVLIGLECLAKGVTSIIAHLRGVMGAIQQMWYRPLISALINIAVSVILVSKYGVCGVVIGTICSYLFSNLIMEPKVIYKYCFNGYKKVSEYYKTLIAYCGLLIVVGIVDYGICFYVIRSQNRIISLIMHFLVCAFSVPVIFALVFWRTPKMRYIVGKYETLYKKIKKR